MILLTDWVEKRYYLEGQEEHDDPYKNPIYSVFLVSNPSRPVIVLIKDHRGWFGFGKLKYSCWIYMHGMNIVLKRSHDVDELKKHAAQYVRRCGYTILTGAQSNLL